MYENAFHKIVMGRIKPVSSTAILNVEALFWLSDSCSQRLSKARWLMTKTILVLKQTFWEVSAVLWYPFVLRKSEEKQKFHPPPLWILYDYYHHIEKHCIEFKQKLELIDIISFVRSYDTDKSLSFQMICKPKVWPHKNVRSIQYT